MIRLLIEELPPGVLQLAAGDGSLGATLATHAGVDVVVHVGSVSTGRPVAAACAARGAKAVLELGGKDPMIVDARVDPVWAAEQAAVGHRDGPDRRRPAGQGGEARRCRGRRGRRPALRWLSGRGRNGRYGSCPSGP